MDAQRWQRVAELYELAYARKPEERQGFLREACAGDNGLLGEVQELLQQDVSRRGILEKIAEVLERQPGERSDYLDQLCAEPWLRNEVESMITAEEQGNSRFMEGPAVEGANTPLQRDISIPARRALAKSSEELLDKLKLLVRSMGAEDFFGTERFTVLRRLGAGGMGVVYEAQDLASGEIVALK